MKGKERNPVANNNLDVRYKLGKEEKNYEIVAQTINVPVISSSHDDKLADPLVSPVRNDTVCSYRIMLLVAGVWRAWSRSQISIVRKSAPCERAGDGVRKSASGPDRKTTTFQILHRSTDASTTRFNSQQVNAIAMFSYCRFFPNSKTNDIMRWR